MPSLSMPARLVKPASRPEQGRGTTASVPLWQNLVVISILRKERELVRHFRDAGAVSPSSAKSLDGVHVGHHALGLRRLRARAVIREAQPDRFYLDEEVWHALGRSRRQVSLAVLALIVLLFVGVLAVKRLIAL